MYELYNRDKLGDVDSLRDRGTVEIVPAGSYRSGGPHDPSSRDAAMRERCSEGHPNMAPMPRALL